MLWSCADSNGCQVFRGAPDKQTDTVKINFGSLGNCGDKENVAPKASGAGGDKENVAPEAFGAVTRQHDPVERQKQAIKGEEERQCQEQEEKEEQERQRREQELQKEKERKLQEQKEQMRRLAQERQRRLAEEQRAAAEQKRLQLEAEQAEFRRRQEEQRRLQEEEAERLRLDVLAKQMEEKRSRLQDFLTTAGFKSVNEQKKKSGIFSGFTYPLHAAVKANNVEAVELLLWARADTSLKDSNKLSPADLAKKLNKKDSHRAILALLKD